MSTLVALGAPMVDEDLLAPLRTSYLRFLQPETPPEQRGRHGIEAALAGFFPVASPDGAFTFEYVRYELDRPRYSAAECRRRGLIHAAVLKLTVRYVIRDPQATRDVREQEIYFGELPLMDADGSFVFDGQRVRLMARTLEAWLPEDGAGAPPRRRLMLPGEWLARAFHLGLTPLGPSIQKAFASRHAASLMPHDVIEADEVMRSLRRLFEDPLIAEPLQGNAAARLDRLRCVAGPVTLGKTRAKKIGKESAVEAPLPLAAGPTLGVAAALVPFASEAERGEGARVMREARVLIAPTAPRVRTGLEVAAARALGLAHRAAHDGTLEILDEETALLWPDDATREDLGGVVLAFDRRLPAAREGERTRFCRASGEAVRASEIVAEAEGSVGGVLALGREARVILDPHAEGVIVSADFAEAMRATRLHTFQAELRHTPHGAEEPCSPPEARLDEEGMAPIGARIDPGSMLVGITSWLDVGPLKTPADRRAHKARYPEGVPRADRSLFAPAGVSGTVIGVEILRRPGSDPAGREPLVLSRARSILDAALRRGGPLAEALRWETEDQIHRITRGYDLPPGVIRWARVTVEAATPLGVGDRLVDRRGFGGVVTAIVPASEMPACCGARADVILPGARVPSGTRREARLGHAGLVLDEVYVGEAGDEAVAAVSARAGLAGEGREGVLYLLALDAPERAR